MSFADYSNPSENIVFARLETNLSTQDGGAFTFNSLETATEPIYETDDIIGKHIHIPLRSYLLIENLGLAVGTGDFTLDFWGYCIGKQCAVANHTSAGEPGYTIAASEPLVVLGSGDGGSPFGTMQIDGIYDEWAHYALVRKDSVLYSFTNGKLIATVDNNTNFTSTALAVNASTSNSFDRFCGSNNKYKFVRVCGFARWTEDFLPPNPGGEKDESFVIILKYQDQDGNNIKAEKHEKVDKAKNFSTIAPAISGYKAIGYILDGATLLPGDAITLPIVNADHTIIFVYKKDDSGEDKANCCCCCCKPIINIATAHINVYCSCQGNSDDSCCQ